MTQMPDPDLRTVPKLFGRASSGRARAPVANVVAAKAPTGAQVAPMARRAVARRRHWMVLISFLIVVALPVAVSGAYLYLRAQDQYASTVGFAVHSEDISAATDILGGLVALGGGGGADTDILYEYLHSQALVQALDARLDLRSKFGTRYGRDPVFAFDATGSIEDLTRYWARMVKVFYDPSTHLIELRVHAFSATDAQQIAEAVFDESSRMINGMSAIARTDATQYAREELDQAEARLRAARLAMGQFRARHQMVDPEVELGLQTGVMSALQTQLSEALVDYDMLRGVTRAGDTRLKAAESRIAVIRTHLAAEREKFGPGGTNVADYSGLVGTYEGLLVDREFAEGAYIAALAAYDSARTEAQRQSRYLAPYIQPTLAERAQYPQRAMILALIAVFCVFTWAIATLIAYAIKDRR